MAIWYLLQGKWEGVDKLEQSLSLKIGKMISAMGKENVPALRDRVKATIEKPVEEFLARLPETQQQPEGQEVAN